MGRNWEPSGKEECAVPEEENDRLAAWRWKDLSAHPLPSAADRAFLHTASFSTSKNLGPASCAASSSALANTNASCSHRTAGLRWLDPTVVVSMVSTPRLEACRPICQLGSKLIPSPFRY
ncbi:hypothetical protein VTN96DRAFT_8475 [Rasamsonia emersonii]